MPARFRKKPVEIEAIQWDGTAPGATVIIDWILGHGGTARYDCNDREGCVDGPDGGHHIAVDTPDATGRIFKNDWAIKGVHGEFYPCKAHIFADTFEAAEGDVAAPTKTIAMGLGTIAPVHFLTKYGSLVHAATFGTAFDLRVTTEQDKVTCALCLGQLWGEEQ